MTEVRIHDAARGTRRIERADGSILLLDRDDRRRTFRVCDDAGPLLSLRADGESVVGDDPTGTTTVGRQGHSTRVERRTADGRSATARMVLRIDRDEAGRPTRVTVPGSASDLHVRPTGAGRWRVETDDGRLVVELTSSGEHGRAVRFANGWGWDERASAGKVVALPTDGGRGVTTELDRGGRVVGRVGVDGISHRYERDARGRLVAWSGPAEVRWEFRPSEEDRPDAIIAVSTDGRRRRVRTDTVGRTTALIGGGRPTVRHEHDAAGRRTVRRAETRATRYRYDSLDQLVAVDHPDGRRTEMGWDALGRRVWVSTDGERLDEHRDVDGRLWAVTDADGRAIHTFLWWEGRVIARLDGPVGTPVAEAYLTDPLGTLVAVATPEADGSWRTDDTIGDPYGRITAPYRPTVFGHMADRSSGLICVGCRLLDPETASFLTPDPWHGGPDDPRVLAGATPHELARGRESPGTSTHPVAISRFDPLSRPDLDGHFAWGNFFLSLILAPTWGFPLTSLSVFFFLPLDIYLELAGLIAFIFTDHPWPHHSFVNMKGLAGSTTLGTAALALNGFLPRAIAGGGVGNDRAVTIGHVAWENRHYFTMLDRACVLMLQDVAGAPAADGTPDGGATAFSRTARGSIVVVESVDDDNRRWIHGSWWTRGGGNRVAVRGTDQTFEDHATDGAAHTSGSILLAQPMREVMAAPREPDDDGRVTVTEYPVHATVSSRGEIMRDQWFAIAVSNDTGLAGGDAIRIRVGDDDIEPAFAGIQGVLTGDTPILLLDSTLPSRFQVDSFRTSIEVTELSVASGSAAGSSAGWTAPPVTAETPANRSLTTAAPGHRVRVGDVVAITPTPTTPSAEQPVVYGEIRTVRADLDLTVAPPAGIDAANAFLLAPDGTVGRGTVPDPAGDPATVTVTGDHDFEIDDMIAVHPAAGDPHHAVATNVTAAADGSPATLTLDPPIPGAVVSVAGAAVRLARLHAADRDRDTGEVATSSGTTVTVETRSNEVFPAGSAVLFEIGPAISVRTVATVSATTIVLVDPMAPTGGPALGPDFAIEILAMVHEDHDGRIAADRFIRHVSGNVPGDYGEWPAQIMGLVPRAYSLVGDPGTGAPTPERAPLGWRFFVKPSAPVPDLHPDYQDFWTPLTIGSDHYWVLSSPVRITENDGTLRWEPDLDNTHPRRHTQSMATAPGVHDFEVDVRAFARATPAVQRPLPGGAPVFCRPAETQVPDEPRIRWSLGDALDEHELAHTVQNIYWGPLLGALPLQGLFRTTADTFAAAGKERPDWMLWHPFDHLDDSVGFDDTNVFEMLSMAGLMQLVWTFVILGPALGDDDAQRRLLALNFSDWGQVFNPVNQQIINHIPEVDPDADAGDRWGLYFANLAARALDMRSWTPLIGMVPLLLPDGPTNPLEQQASRWTGDIYSTLLTVDDDNNRTLRLRLGNALLVENRDADRSISLGESVRVMIYLNMLDRYLPYDRCDAPTELVHLIERFARGRNVDFVDIRLTATPGGGPALLRPDLVADTSLLTARQVQGPELPDPANPGSAIRVDYDFVEVPVGRRLEPTPRSMTPAGPAVTRAMGFYFVPNSEGTYTFTAWDGFRNTGDLDPFTYTATVTVAGEVKVDDDDVEWVMPLAAATAGPPPPLPSGDVSRMTTQRAHLAVTGQDTTDWIAEADGAVSVERVAGGRGWTLVFGDPGGGLPVRNRVRVWRPVRGDDPELFDFEHRDEPTRAGVRSYLDEEFWIPVRDFSVETTEIPVLADTTISAADEHVRNLPLDVAGAGRIVVTPTDGRTLVHEQADDERMDLWRFELDGTRALEASLTFPVRVTFGRGAVTVDRGFDLTVDPNFTIDTPAAGGPYVVSEAGGPLTLEIDGGTAPFEVTGDLPDGVTTSVAGSTITVTADATASPGSAMLVIEDAAEHLGIRSLRVEL